MPDFGVTALGFRRKRLADILAGFTAELNGVQDPATGEHLTVDLQDENDPLVQVVNAFADSLADAWDQLEAAYGQFDPLRSSGAALSGLVQLNSLVRKAGVRSAVTLTLSGTQGTVVAAGKRVSTIDSAAIFTTDTTVTIGGGGTVSATATATVDGPIAAPAASLVRILSPVSGWVGVTNAADAVLGTYEETDAALRVRRAASTSAPARGIIESIYAGVANLPGVGFARAFQNITLSTDGRGIPAKTVAVVVEGGEEEVIALELFRRVPAGADTFGTTEVDVVDEQGFTYPMRFSRPAPIDVYVEVQVKVVAPWLWPANGADLVKAAIVNFAAYGASILGIPAGYDQNGYLPGEAVYASELYIPVHSVPGIQVVALTIGETVSPTDAEVAIAWNERAAFDVANIDVVVVS